MTKFLHVGCGSKTKADLKGFNSPEWQEVRYDIDPEVAPDILGTITDLGNVDTESVDAVFSAHNIEHIYAHEVSIALREFHRVLKPDGFLVVTCPDLQTVCEAIVQDRLLEPLYQAKSGPIAPLDILYGHRASIARGQIHMAHKCGFTFSVLGKTLNHAGYNGVFGCRRLKNFDLWFLALKSQTPQESLRQAAQKYFPD